MYEGTFISKPVSTDGYVHIELCRVGIERKNAITTMIHWLTRSLETAASGAGTDDLTKKNKKDVIFDSSV